jgi:hypothetical protein
VVEVFDTDDQTAGNQGWEDALNDLAGCSTAPCALVLPGDTPNYPPSSGSDVSQGWSQWSFPDSKEARTFVILPID